MQLDDKLLQVVSNETKDSVCDIDIVTPIMYTSVFSKVAIKHDVDIDDEEAITEHFLDEKIAHFTHMQTKIAENAEKLSENTDRAIFAINEKNEKILKEVLRETKKLKQEIKELKESMYKDELTHSYNRKWIHDNALDEEGHGFKGSGTLAIIDLNDFKKINDTYGHTIGDKVLVYIAEQLKKTNEAVARYGGDEFLVMFCNDIEEETANSILHDIRKNVLKKNMKVKGGSFKVSFAYGVEKFNKGDSLLSIIEKADKKMYKDKIDIKNKAENI